MNLQMIFKISIINIAGKTGKIRNP
jgi:hypothetical protein